jgi:hypothetical protein
MLLTGDIIDHLLAGAAIGTKARGRFKALRVAKARGQVIARDTGVNGPRRGGLTVAVKVARGVRHAKGPVAANVVIVAPFFVHSEGRDGYLDGWTLVLWMAWEPAQALFFRVAQKEREE